MPVHFQSSSRLPDDLFWHKIPRILKSQFPARLELACCLRPGLHGRKSRTKIFCRTTKCRLEIIELISNLTLKIYFLEAVAYISHCKSHMQCILTQWKQQHCYVFPKNLAPRRYSNPDLLFLRRMRWPLRHAARAFLAKSNLLGCHLTPAVGTLPLRRAVMRGQTNSTFSVIFSAFWTSTSNGSTKNVCHRSTIRSKLFSPFSPSTSRPPAVLSSMYLHSVHSGHIYSKSKIVLCFVLGAQWPFLFKNIILVKADVERSFLL
jgi:hypothetical protein